MIVLVCGVRHLDTGHTRHVFAVITTALQELPAGTEIIHGAAPGVDSIAGSIAKRLGFAVTRYPAEWTRYGKRAGPIRNQIMLNRCPARVLAFHTDPFLGKGTADMVRRARDAGVPVTVRIL